MTKKFQMLFPISLIFFILSSCDSVTELNHGYEMLDGEGSEIYLLKDGHLIFYDVSLIAKKK